MPTFLICRGLATAMRASEQEQADEPEHDQRGQDTEDDFFLFGDSEGHVQSGQAGCFGGGAGRRG